MGLGTATIEMQNPEEHRERLHELVKATRAVLVLSCGHDDRIVGQPMVLLRTDDDTTMYVATALDAAQRQTLAGDPRVTIVVPGAGCAMFDAEARISRDRSLLEALPDDARRLWDRGVRAPAMTLLVISPIAGAYWDGAHRHTYQYRHLPHGPRAVAEGATSIDVAPVPGAGPSQAAAPPAEPASR